MKKLSFIIILFSLAACQEEEKTFSQYSIEQFYKNINVGGGSFSPDESKLLVSSNETGIYNAFQIDIETGEKTQLTRSKDESYYASSYFPNDDRFIYSFDEGGNENFKVYMMDRNRKPKNLTPGDSIRNGFLGWSRDEQSLYFSSNKRDPKYMDIYKMGIESVEEEVPQSTMIYQNSDGLDVGAIASNERYFALTQVITSAEWENVFI